MAAQQIEQARFNMVQQQIRPWEVLDQRVLDIVQAVPREAFVPEAFKGLAFADIEIPIGHDQHMMFPRVEARMLQALNPQPDETILEVGTGSGYITACLARLGGQVTSIELYQDLSEQAGERLAEVGVENATLQVGDVMAGDMPEGPFDVIAVTGSVPSEDIALEWRSRLNPGGRMFIVIGEPPVMEAVLYTREDESAFRRESLFETLLAPLVGIPPREHFQF